MTVGVARRKLLDMIDGVDDHIWLRAKDKRKNQTKEDVWMSLFTAVIKHGTTNHRSGNAEIKINENIDLPNLLEQRILKLQEAIE